MSLILNKSEATNTLKGIGKQAAKIAKAAYALSTNINEFSGDGSLMGATFESARSHFGDEYGTALLQTIQVCDELKANAEEMIKAISVPFTLDRGILDESILEKQREALHEEMKGYKQKREDNPELKYYYSKLIERTQNIINDYDETIKDLKRRNRDLAKCFDSTDKYITSLVKLIDSITVGCVRNKNRELVFSQRKESDINELRKLKDELANKYTDAVMKSKFDPVNMATGCYVSDKSFLKAEGLVPLKFEIRYNSTDPLVHSLGRGWNHNHNISLEEASNHIKLKLRAERTETYLKKGNEIVNADGFSGRKLERTEGEENAYIYTDEDGIKYFFDAEGQCTKITNSEGFTIHYGYEEEKLTSVDTDFGTGYRLKYKEEMLVEVTDLSGRSIQFKHEEDKLVQIIDECGEEYKYEYDDFGRMHKVVNARGTVNLVNTYDGLGRVLKQEFPDEGETRFEYIEDKKTIKVAAQDGTVSEYEHDEKFRSTEERYRKGLEKVAYDAANNKVSETDRNGNETKYEYDEHGNCTAKITALGDRYEYEYDEAGRQTKISLNGDTLGTFEYSENGRLTSETDALGRTVRTEYDERNLIKTVILADGTVISYENDAQGNISKLIDENGNEWRYSYDKLNRVTETVDANGNKESFEYNARSEITKMTNAAGDSRIYEYNPSGKLTHVVDFDGNEEFAEYNELNKISKYTDKDGNSTFFEYDKMWNLSKTIDAEGGVNLYTYDGDGNLISQTDANFNTREYSRDANGNIIKESDEDGNYIKYEYDELNRVKAVIYKDGTEEHIQYDAHGNELKFIDAAGNEWQSEYNFAGELMKRINPEGLETVYTYDLRGNLISEETEEFITRYEYDKAGNITKRINPDSTEETYSYDANGNMTERVMLGVHFNFCYDCLDRLTEVKREGQVVRSFEYDKVGNRVAVTDALGNTTRYIRSKAGAILTAIDPLGHETHYTYDKCHRLIGIDQGEGRVTIYTRDKVGNVLTATDALGNTEKYEYDCNNNVIAKTDMDGNRTTIGRNIYGDVAKIKYADSTEVEYSYDSLRRLKEVKDSLGITTIERDILGRETKVTDYKGRAVSYCYDKVGRRTGITYPSGKHVAYEFDKYGRNTKIKTDDVEASMSYDAFGRIEERRSTDLLTSYAYDRLGRLSELTYKRNNEIIHSEILSYDAEDNVLSDGKNHFEYDELGRLIKTTEENGSSREYSYDAYGNRASLTENGNTVTYLYDEADQLLSASNGLSFKYDKRGNVIEKSLNGEILNTYIYGANNRLKQAGNSKGDMATYKYNGLGRRVSRKTASNEIDYLLDQTKMYNNLLEADGEEYIWDENNLLFRNEEAQIRDRLGSPVGEDEFGMALEPGTLGFTGYMYDDISGTYFAQAREYMPEAGRFAGRDIVKGSILQPLTLNNYNYCYSNPNKYVDLDGNIPIVVAVAAGAIIAYNSSSMDKILYIPTKEEHYNRNMYNTGLPQNVIKAQKAEWDGTVPADCHQATATNGPNIKYVSPDGHREVIYDSSGETIVNDPRDIGTYNYWPINKSGHSKAVNYAGHFTHDILPWIVWGNSENDPSNPLERINMSLPGDNPYYTSPHYYGKQLSMKGGSLD